MAATPDRPGSDAATADARSDRRRTLALGLTGALLCYLAHPPVDWGWLAWVGPTPWLLLVRAPRMPGRRPYWMFWLSGAAFWLAAIQWIRLPYPANIVFLALLAAYLGAYLPAFAALARTAVHRFGAPLWLAGAVAWIGLEWLRAHLLTGFPMASLAHTQADFPWIIQIADLGGEYAVTFLIVLVAGAIAEAISRLNDSGRWPARHAGFGRWIAAGRALAPAALALAVTLGYGAWRGLPDASRVAQRRPVPRIVLVQSDMLADWKGTRERDQRVMAEQLEQSLRAVRASSRPVDLVVWPETMFRQPLFVRDRDNPPPSGAIVEANYTAAANDLRAVAEQTGTALLVGIDRVMVFGRALPAGEPSYHMLVYNSAAFVDRDGNVQGTYDKMHLLPFGEFIPFQAWLPILRDFAPITGNALWGARAEAFELDGVFYAPSICYETVLPHLIRRQVREVIARESVAPDVLVNLTNDAWYWGSSELDMHLASGVFRAVEMRTPLVIAANRGLSAYVDSSGRVVAVTERDRADALTVDVELPERRGAAPTLYAAWGDWLPGACLVCCVVLAVVGRRRSPA